MKKSRGTWVKAAGLLALGAALLALIISCGQDGEGATFQVTFYGNGKGATPASLPVDVKQGGKLTPPDGFSRDGFSLEGWYKDKDDFANKWVFDVFAVTEDGLKLYAKWLENGKDTCTVTFIAEGGTPPRLEVTVEKGTRVPRPVNITREGYVIDGWSTNENLTGSWSFNSNVNENINLYARWATTAEDGRIYINALAAYPLRGAPVTGNYPQALFRFPFASVAGNARESYIQTLEWDPPVEKVFAANTAYTATYTFEPVETHVFGELSPEKISGLPEGAGVQVSGASEGGKYIVTIKYDATGAQKGARTLLFEDNFGGSRVDSAKWNVSTSANRHDLSIWEPDMVSVANDSLIIGMKIDPTIDKGTFPGKWIRAGAVTSSRLFESTYGYFEARIKYPPAYNGMNLPWGAFWLNGRTTGLSPYGGKMGTEVDVVEFIHNKRPCFNSALHWDGYNYEDGSHQSVGKESVQDLGQGKTNVQFDAVNVYDDDFHTFAFDWSPEGYKFIIDGFLFWEVKEGSRHYWDGANRTVGVCQNPLYMLFSIEAAPWSNFPQGTWPLGWPGDKMEIKSVRVWNQPPETPPIIP